MAAEYQHVSECVYSNMITWQESEKIHFGCACEEYCDDEENCICLAQHDCAYDNSGILKNICSREPVYECNTCCACPSTCINRLVQRTPPWKLKTFPTDEKGFGLKTLDFIPKGSFVIEYVGEIILSTEALERSSKLMHMDSCYMLSVKEHFGTVTYTHHIDASKIGNLARFINHSCEPNLCVIPVRV